MLSVPTSGTQVSQVFQTLETQVSQVFQPRKPNFLKSSKPRKPKFTKSSKLEIPGFRLATLPDGVINTQSSQCLTNSCDLYTFIHGATRALLIFLQDGHQVEYRAMLIYGYLLTFISCLHALTLECQAIHLLEVLFFLGLPCQGMVGLLACTPWQVCALPCLP